MAEASTNEAQCSYAITQNQAFHQPIYVCRTCNPQANNVCCCAGCAETCHKDHEVDIIAFGEAYCDCGASNCLLYQVSTLAPSFCMLSSLAKTRFKQSSPFSSSCQIDNIDYSAAIAEALHITQQSKETFWLNKNASPTCYLESLALSIGTYHLSTLLQDETNAKELAQQSGFEWWLQVKPLTSESDDNTGVDLHYDKDEEIATQWNIGLFPTISTVTYLSFSQACCHPTVVFGCTAANPVEAAIQNCFISLPKLGKHVSFTGNLLHGAPHQLLPLAQKNLIIADETSDSVAFEKRITFLVNVWVGHRPMAVNPLPVEINPCFARDHDSMNISNFSSANISFAAELPVLTIPITEDLLTIDDDEEGEENDKSNNEEGEWITIPFVSTKAQWGRDEDEAGLELTMLIPPSHCSLAQFHAQTMQAAKLKKAAQKQSKDKKLAKAIKKQITSVANEVDEMDYSRVSSFHLQYLDENVAARLQYEMDEDELDDQFMTMG